MKMQLRAAILLLFAGTASAGDLVMKLGTQAVPVYHRIPVTGSVTISPSTGDIIVDPVANAGIAADGWCPATGQTCGTPVPTFSTALTVSAATLPFGGGSVTLNWVAANATTCTATANPAVAGWSGNVTSPTTVNLTATGTYTFDLTCTGPCGSVAAAPNTVTVQPQTLPNSCSTRPPPTGVTRQSSMTNSPRFPQNFEFNNGATIGLTGYSPILSTFPAVGQSAYVFIDTSKYVAMEFTTTGTATGVVGEIAWEQPSTNGAPLWVTLSECPGDFEWMTDGKCKVHNGASAITWVVGAPTQAPTWACHLEPNKTYYLNAIFSSAETYTTTTCGGSICHWFITGAGRSSFSAPPAPETSKKR